MTKSAWRKANRKIMGCYMYGCRWYLTHPISFIRDVFKETKAFIQRGYRGYADCDLWSFDDYLDVVLSNALKDFSELNNSYPAIKGAKTSREWKRVLKEMAEGFEDMAYYNSEGMLKDKNYQGWKKADKKHKQSLKLLIKWWRHLWD